MYEVHGKQVPDSLTEVVDPAHTALLVVDMQKDFLDPAGAGRVVMGQVYTASKGLLPW